MASRPKPTGSRENEEDVAGRPAAPSRRSSTTTTTSSASKIPTYTSSFFSRSRHKREETEKIEDGQTSQREQRRVAETAVSKGFPQDKVTQRSTRSFGFGTRAEVKQKPTPTAKSESHQRNRLRRKTSSSDQHSQYAQSESTMPSYNSPASRARLETVSSPGGYSDPFPGAILGMTIPGVSSSTSNMSRTGPLSSEQATSSSRMATYTSRYQPHRLSTHDLPPPTPSFAANSSSSSTRHSESPGPFSRTSTPTSISSYSPGIPLPPKSASRVRPISPTRSRPPVTRRKIGGASRDGDSSDVQGLPAVRESLTSSSSSSTVRGGDRVESSDAGQTKPRSRLSPPPPTPPLRLSSKRLPRLRNDPQSIVPKEKSAGPQSSRNLRSSESATTIQSSGSKDSTISHSRKKGPPPRPSREDTPLLDEPKKLSPIIQSNLSSLATTGHTRRESIEKAAVNPSTSTKSPVVPRPAIGRSSSSASTSSRKPSKLPSPSLTTAPIPQPQVRGTSRQKKPPPPHAPTTVSTSIKEPSPSSSSPAKSQSRFGFFSRRTKSPHETVTPIVAEKATKKGPAAGTGHEGYGKYAKRGRSSSMSTSASRGRSTSVDSTSTKPRRPPSTRKNSTASQGESEIDDFLRERLSPVVITGGGATLRNPTGGLGIYRTNSRESSSDVRSSFDSASSIPATAFRNYYGSESRQAGHIGQSLESITVGLIPGLQEITEGSHENLSLDKNLPSKRPTLAARRSFHRSQLFKEAEPMKIPAPINTQALEPSPSLDSYNTMNSAVPRTDSTIILTDDFSEGYEGNWLKPKKLEKRARSPKKWNFFQRAHNSPKKFEAYRYPNESGSKIDMPVTIARISEPRSVAHYAMLDSPGQEGSDDPLERLLHDMENEASIGFTERSGRLPQMSPKQGHEYTMLLPSPPVLPKDFSAPQRPSSPKVALIQPDLVSQSTVNPATKQSRLPQVGRIPRVVSKRDRLHNPPPHSFSRPFGPKPTTPGTSASEPDVPFAAEHPVLPVQPEQNPLRPDDSYGNIESTSTTIMDSYQFSEPSKQAFFAFPPRKGSEVSGSSSSGILSFAAITALAPNPDSALSEDEVWNEYDELLDRVTSPVSTLTGSTELPRYIPMREQAKQLQERTLENSQRESSVIKSPRSSESTVSAKSPQPPPPSRNLPSPPGSLTLPSPRRSSAFATTPLSLTDFYAGYGDRSSTPFTAHRHSSSSSRYSVPSRIGSRSSRGSDAPVRNPQLMDKKSGINSSAQKSLRFSALMASRWLSFDRVLFSPVHDEIRNNRQDRVLVLDGLGNDDWSSFCALTYPDATIYNLSSTRPTSANRKRGPSAWQPPSNHRQIHHASIAHPFPFPKGFFTAVVFRFPVANSEDAYRNAISECKRVLRPGGYLEMSILDIDMVNMGNRARRAVRALKVRMQVADPGVSLKPASDELQKMLGRRGFENLNRCMVGVPVAGQVSESRSGSLDEERNEQSLGEMLRDASAVIQQAGTSGNRAEDSMVNMMPKVGRWWYSRCYETSVVAEDEPEDSLWADKALLKECEKRDTGFKLLICYAQKPLSQRRRTVSV